MKILLLILSTAIFSLSFSDETKTAPEHRSYSDITKTRYPNYIGIAAGGITGHGISYRRWIKNTCGFQINLIPYYRDKKYPEENNFFDYVSDRDSGYYKETYFSGGITYLHNMGDLRYIRFTTYAGANIEYNFEDYDYYEKYSFSSSNKRHKGKKEKTMFEGGIGFGAEWYVWRIAFHLMGGIGGSYHYQNRSKEIGVFSMEGGVHYRF